MEIHLKPKYPISYEVEEYTTTDHLQHVVVFLP